VQPMEKRKLKRRNLIYYLRVVDRANNRLVGRLVDLTTEGMMLISENPLASNQTYHMKMVLPAEIDLTREIHIDAQSQWTKPDVNPELYATGFHFLRVSPQDIGIIKDLIADYELPT
jgi:hypothetical protein